jgi:hypothetical protein
VRKLFFASLLLLSVLALAACGGGGSSSGSGSTESTVTAGAGTPEGAWAKEVKGVMSEFENSVSAQLTEEISTAQSQNLLEPLYATYAVDLAVLSRKLDKTKAPKQCAALHTKMVGLTKEAAELTKKLGEQSKLSQTEYSFKVTEEGQRFNKIGEQLGKLTLKPKC